MASRLRRATAGPRVLGVLASAVLAAALAACAATDPDGGGPGAAVSRSAAANGAAGSHSSATGMTPSAGTPREGRRSASAGSHAAGGAAARTTAAGDTPPGFWFGTDSFTMSVTGTGPYNEPLIGGSYGGYTGMAGNWAHWQGCSGKLVWSTTNANQASTNLSTYHKGVGTGVYWFMAGPGVDPNYNGTVSQATTWGQQQAARTLADIGTGVQYPVVWMDVELPGNAPQYTPAPDNGWNNVYTAPCSGTVKTQHISAAVDRAVLDGYAAYLTAHSSYKAGVYSAPPAWRAIFGTGSAAQIP
ncbi:MAG: hypothetical protein ACTHJW_02705, partial [Streptosporangiaceae bacterium]